jgi:type I restriction enzyme S subunit
MSSELKPLLLPLFAPTVKSDWSWERLDCVADVYDCPHSTPSLVDDCTAPYVVRSQDLRSGSFLLDSAARVSLETYQERIKRVEPQFGDLIYSREGTYFGIAAEVPKGIKVCLGQRMVLIRADCSRIYHSFLKYWLNSPQVFSHIHGFRDGTVAERLNLPVIRGLAIAFPPLAIQREIADALTALDDRIALLRETNATLEAIAQALFKSWFVDFDPVHAKQQGRAPDGMDEAIAALFPDSFEESELGLVPRGWKVGRINDFAEQHKGSINPLKNAETLFEHYSLPAFDSQQLPVSELGTEIKSNKTTVPRDAVLLSKLNPHIPRVWLSHDPGSNAVCSTEFLVFVPSEGASKEFIYCAFTTANIKVLLCQLVTGTSNSHQRVKPDSVASVSAVIPQTAVLKAFTDLSKPVFARVGHNRKQAQTLATLRDTLLPRLISGQLRLPEAEALIEDAA